MQSQLDRIEQMIEDLLSRLGGTGAASVENEVAMVKARGGNPVKYFKEKARRQMEESKPRRKSRRTVEEGQHLDECIDIPVSWRLTRLAKAWDCPLVAAVERLILEADEKYSDILFPEMK